MRASELLELIGAERLGGPPADEVAVRGGFTSDLLSDVVANAKEGDLLITIQAHKNTVAVATLVGAPAIAICSGREIPPDMVRSAESEGVLLCRTAKNQFEVSGLLFCALAGAAAPGMR